MGLGERAGRGDRLAPVRFGTSGWRGVLGEGFHFAGARAVARAVAERVCREAAAPRVVVARDTRFLGERLAAEAAEVLEGAGVRAVVAAGPVPTPVASFAVRRRRAAAGLVFTASHNPPEYQGLKVVAPWGGAAPPEWTRALEAEAARWLRRASPLRRPSPRRSVDLAGPYQRAVLGRLAEGSAAGVRVVYDALHGAGAGVLDPLLAALGARVVLRRGSVDPCFGGAAPDPRPERLGELAREVARGRGLRLGLATDGDADRFAAVDEAGRSVSESDALALLVDHLARTGRVRRGIALSVATGSLVERVARAHGLSVERHPIGFKHLTAALLAGRADLAGEESGGFAWAPLAHDKDGLLASCLLVERLAAAGRPLSALLRALWREHGRSACGRTAVADPAGAGAVAALRGTLPARVDGVPVRGVETVDGVRAVLPDGFLMWRGSGTEPVVRVYAEAPTPQRLARRLAAGLALLRRARR